jgi:Flp pilus assembly secretin CpaC
VTETLSSEWIDSEQYLGPKMKRITFECEKCSHVWTRTYRAEPKHDPKCPNKSCADKQQIADLKREMANLRSMIESGQAPAQIGHNIRTKAIDKTAEIVMADHHMTDLKDNIRQGETMAPKLSTVMQRQADTLFTAAKPVGQAPIMGASQSGSRVSSKFLARVGAKAIAGGYRMNSVAPTAVTPKHKPAPIVQSNPMFVKRS